MADKREAWKKFASAMKEKRTGIKVTKAKRGNVKETRAIEKNSNSAMPECRSARQSSKVQSRWSERVFQDLPDRHT